MFKIQAQSIHKQEKNPVNPVVSLIFEILLLDYMNIKILLSMLSVYDILPINNVKRRCNKN
jgi:hypothetical protein